MFGKVPTLPESILYVAHGPHWRPKLFFFLLSLHPSKRLVLSHFPKPNGLLGPFFLTILPLP